MYIILGSTGHVGSAVARTLLDRGQPVTVVTRDAANAEDLRKLGAAVAVADVSDAAALRKVFQSGRRAFLLNPPGDIAGDPSEDEERTISSIVSALEGSGLEKIVAASTYGAQPGERLGDLSTLFAMEQALNRQAIPVTNNRAAYYMSNWDASVESARERGTVKTFYPVQFQLPMVAPADIGAFAAESLLEPPEQNGLRMIEGPDRYSSEDVAEAFAVALGKPVRAVEIPETEWLATFRKMGFSEVAAESFANMTRLTKGGDFPALESVVRGTTTLGAYIGDLVRKNG